MSDAPDFRIGDRIRINPESADSYVKPWPARIRKGLFGTITGGSSKEGWYVQLDMPKRAKWPHDWKWGSVRSCDMVMADADAGSKDPRRS